MTWRDEIDMEIRRQAIRLYPDCAALVLNAPQSLRTDHAGQQHEEKALPGERGEEQEDHCYNARISVRGWSARCIKEFPLRSSSK